LSATALAAGRERDKNVSLRGPDVDLEPFLVMSGAFGTRLDRDEHRPSLSRLLPRTGRCTFISFRIELR